MSESTQDSGAAGDGLKTPVAGAESVEAEVAETETELLARAIAEAAAERKACDIKCLDVRGIVSYADFIIVMHGTSSRHAKSIADFIVSDLRPLKIRPHGIEGQDYGEWILVDFVDVVVHIFNDTMRDEYAIESIYSDAPRLEFDLEDGSPPFSTPAAVAQPAKPDGDDA